ncbi:MAG: hypothetical protein KKH34_01915 [Candidatus Omnitrophica bacterium]|nr:hypothetical protein [Candidatus Omnitrophota bacterium]MCG2703988.1 hypothetical protein [Candidatus Omnitrophota bacterium]
MDKNLQNNEFYQKGLAALRKKNYDYAIELFSNILKNDSDNGEYRHQLWAASRAKKNASAKSIVTLISDKILFLFLGVQSSIFALGNKLNEARQIQEKITFIFPASLSAFSRLAALYLREKKTGLAITAYEEMLLIEKRNKTALRSLARLYFMKKDFQKARITANTLLKVSAHDLEAENIIKDIAALGLIEKGFDKITPAE